MIVYKSGALSLEEFETARGKRVILNVGCDAVLVVPRTKDGKFLVTVQRRTGKNEDVYEFPSGGINKGETPVAAAARELLEETGATGDLTYIMKAEPLSGLVKFNVFVFLANITNVSETAKSLEEHEDVTTVEITKEGLLKIIKNLETVDGYLLLGLSALTTIEE